MKLKLLKITWVDSGMHIPEGWKPVTESLGNFKYDDLRVVTVGLWAYEDEKVICLGLSYSPSNDQWFGLQIIVKSSIVSMEQL